MKDGHIEYIPVDSDYLEYLKPTPLWMKLVILIPYGLAAWAVYDLWTRVM